jgi:hypothetical protein
VARVHLHQLGAGRAPRGKRQPFGVELRPGDPGNSGSLDASQHVAGAAADLEEAVRARKMPLQRPDDEPAARDEPEVLLLDRRERLEARRVEADAQTSSR